MSPPPHQELRFRSVLAGLLDPVLTIDEFGMILFASDSVEAVFGYAPAELEGRNIKLLMPEPHHSAHDGYLAKYRATGATWILNTIREFEAVRKTGEVFWVELSVARIDVPGDERPYFTGSLRDISARKQIEHALRDSEARFHAIFDAEIELVGLLDREGRVLEMNRAALASGGTTRGEVISRPFWETIWWVGREDQVRDWVERAGRGEMIREELTLSVSGATMHVDFSLKPIRNDRGEVILLLPEGRDVTALKAAQARETEVLRALAILGEQASVLAHEIKNPITSVNLALRAVADKLGAEEAEVMEGLITGMSSLERKLRETLSFAKPLELELTSCPLLPLLLAPVDILRDEAELRGVDLCLEVAPGLPPVEVDAGRLEDVVTNLVRNALDSVAAEGTILVEASGGDGDVLIVVEDDGAGLPDRPVEELFRPFVTTRPDGTGIGLALARKVIEAHRGSLTACASERLGGARFELRLPRGDRPTA